MGRPYKRIVLKLSGEALGDESFPFHEGKISTIAKEIGLLGKKGYEIAIVVGGGNVVRGGNLGHLIDRVAADHMGMLGTCINSIVLREFIAKEGVRARAFSSHGIPGVLDPYEPFVARSCLKEKQVVILGGGTGNPFFTTDTAAILRAKELLADVVFKATKVDYVYDRDPLMDGRARPYKRISFLEVLERKLEVMDITAIAMAMELRIPIYVFNFSKEGNLSKAAEGEEIGTLIWED